MVDAQVGALTHLSVRAACLWRRHLSDQSLFGGRVFCSSSVYRPAHDSRTHHRQKTSVSSLSYVSTGWEDFHEGRLEDCIRGSGGINIPISKRLDEPM
jgi:hypothetical protein